MFLLKESKEEGLQSRAEAENLADERGLAEEHSLADAEAESLAEEN